MSFKNMDKQKMREIAAKGGKAVPASKRSFSTDRELASRAGKLGGSKSRQPHQQLFDVPKTCETSFNHDGGGKPGCDECQNTDEKSILTQE